MATNVIVHDEVGIRFKHGGTLCFQAVTYDHGPDGHEDGFRFIWRDGNANGNLMAHRGGARIPTMHHISILTTLAAERPAFKNWRGWDADDIVQVIV